MIIERKISRLLLDKIKILLNKNNFYLENGSYN